MFRKAKLKIKTFAVLEFLSENRGTAEAWVSGDSPFFAPSGPQVKDHVVVRAALIPHTVWTDGLRKWMVVILETLDSSATSKSLDAANEFAQALESYPDQCHPWIAKTLLTAMREDEANLLLGSHPIQHEQTTDRSAVAYFCAQVTARGLISALNLCDTEMDEEAWDASLVFARLAVDLAPMLPYIHERTAVLLRLAQAAYRVSYTQANIDPSDPIVLEAMEDGSSWFENAKDSAPQWERREDLRRTFESVESELQLIQEGVDDLVLGRPDTRHDEAVSLVNQAIDLMDRGNSTAALTALSHAESGFRQLGEETTLHDCLRLQASIHADHGEYMKSITIYRELESFFTTPGRVMPQGILRSLVDQSEMYIKLGDHAAALECLERHTDISSQVNDTRARIRSLGLQATIHDELGNIDAAAELRNAAGRLASGSEE